MYLHKSVKYPFSCSNQLKLPLTVRDILGKRFSSLLLLSERVLDNQIVAKDPQLALFFFFKPATSMTEQATCEYHEVEVTFAYLPFRFVYISGFKCLMCASPETCRRASTPTTNWGKSHWYVCTDPTSSVASSQRLYSERSKPNRSF